MSISNLLCFRSLGPPLILWLADKFMKLIYYQQFHITPNHQVFGTYNTTIVGLTPAAFTSCGSLLSVDYQLPPFITAKVDNLICDILFPIPIYFDISENFQASGLNLLEDISGARSRLWC